MAIQRLPREALARLVPSGKGCGQLSQFTIENRYRLARRWGSGVRPVLTQIRQPPHRPADNCGHNPIRPAGASAAASSTAPLPRRSVVVELLPSATLAYAMPTRPEIVLIAEAQSLVRMEAVHALASHGYDVLEASNADDAMTWLEARAADIGVLVYRYSNARIVGWVGTGLSNPATLALDQATHCVGQC